MAAAIGQTAVVKDCWQGFVKISFFCGFRFKTNSTILANLCENMQTIFVVAGSEQTEVEDVDYYQIVSPVEQVKDKEDSWEEVHSNPEKFKKFR